VEENQYNPQAIIPQAVIGLDGAGDGNLKRRGAAERRGREMLL